MRLYGQVTLSRPEVLSRLAGTLVPDAVSVSGNILDIDYAGRHTDVEEFLDAAAALMEEGDNGHLDMFDDDGCVLTRYELAPGGHTFKTHRYDDILEHTKGEGNW
ncbi:MAG: hypothetical protein HY795_01430 [Desulfovibrio sp.]|jgi:hypothetical protein|nr:hypothetical protein [Desulfovibrio sp.]MBI4959031.1 hypothetical protein [Desulfovibrio sp.]